MTTRGLAALALVALLGLRGTADEPRLPDATAFDRLVIDTLRDVHNRGADLYNESKDFVGTYRVYQGALATVRPLIGHRPAAQKLIDAGLEAADKEASADRKAFLLHETIEAVRKNLKAATAAPKKSPEPTTKKPEEPKKTETPAKQPDETKKVEPPAKKPEEPKKPALPVAPAPRAVKPKH
ncbi:hypothetical protein R5W23_003346 [Gemmata sp. JC673]|uniref:Uncharacterized protein n=1 Tax=Gemmata algarum TaxID=2975278 RepID=A0ABU5F3E1_9BACT|nr:hypothetical protein [Gemmata algarum]MDY3561916.1 hypothetical protein [Gemmata algarum]